LLSVIQEWLAPSFGVLSTFVAVGSGYTKPGG